MKKKEEEKNKSYFFVVILPARREEEIKKLKLLSISTRDTNDFIFNFYFQNCFTSKNLLNFVCFYSKKNTYVKKKKSYVWSSLEFQFTRKQ